MAGVQIDGVNNKIDFDDDQDTSISANTDDTLVFEVAGATDFTMTANTFTAASGSTIAAQALTATTVGATGVVTANAGVVVDNITIDGTEIDLSSGDLTLDAAGRIDLSADDNGEIRLFDGSSQYAQFKDDSDRLIIQGMIADKDMHFVVNNGGSEATSMVIDSIGAVTKPLQPAFQVHPASQQTNVAGSSGATIAFGTERFDVNADFASNTFTAPVTGKYQMNVLLRLEDIDIDYNYFRVYLNTSNKQYEWLMDPNFTADLDYLSLGFSILVDMDASDTSTVSWEHGGGANQVDISAASMWTGYLVA